MNVLLLQLDGKLPNLALMRIATHHRRKGDTVLLRRGYSTKLWDPTWDKVYISLIFQRTRETAEKAIQVHPHALVGGTGWDETLTIESVGIYDIEPDYSDYPDFRQSLGFTQRGCRLKCPFCVVPRKEGAVRWDNSINTIYRGEPWPKELVLLDNDFFGHPDWPLRIEEIQAGPFKVNFNQGINARMLNDETAAAIASVDYRNARMDRKQIYTAWDNRKDEKRLFAGLNALVKHGVKPRDIMVYMLIGYWPGETEDDRLYRQQQLRDFGAIPYPMPYERTRELVGFQRWIVGAYDKRIPWDEWKKAKYKPENLNKAPL